MYYESVPESTLYPNGKRLDKDSSYGYLFDYESGTDSDGLYVDVTDENGESRKFYYEKTDKNTITFSNDFFGFGYEANLFETESDIQDKLDSPIIEDDNIYALFDDIY